MIRSTLAAALLAGACALAQAGVVPKYDTFGDLAGATFGGTGIPTNPTAISTNAASGITIGLTAHQRFFNPALTNDGAGNFTATAGLNNGFGSSSTIGATWNFGFYVDVGTGQLSDYRIDLFYDLDAAFSTGSPSGRIDLDAIAVANGIGGSNLIQGSENLNFGYLAAGIPGLVVAPGGSFDGNAAGEYSFILRVSSPTGIALAVSAINVNVTTVPEPGSLALVGLVLAGVAAASRRRVR